MTTNAFYLPAGGHCTGTMRNYTRDTFEAGTEGPLRPFLGLELILFIKHVVNYAQQPSSFIKTNKMPRQSSLKMSSEVFSDGYFTLDACPF